MSLPWSNGRQGRNQSANEFLSKIWIGKAVAVQEVRKLAKLTLRNAIWCKLGYKNQFFIHFQYDYYMYIGASEECVKAKEIVKETGLFMRTQISLSIELISSLDLPIALILILILICMQTLMMK